MLLTVSTQVFENDVLSESHLELFKECGYNSIEIFLTKPHFDWHDSSYVRAMHSAMQRLGLSVSGVHSPWMPGADIASLDSQERQNSVANAKKAADLLHLVGGEVLVIHPGAALKGDEDITAKTAICRDSLLDISHYCKLKGIQVALENPPKYELCGEIDKLLALYDSLSQSHIQACFDTGHANIAGGLELWRLTAQEKVYIHLHDNDGVNDSHLPPGDGNLRWEAFFALLKESKFKGIICLELSPTQRTAEVLRKSRVWFEEQRLMLT